jgi:hypothetical protein
MSPRTLFRSTTLVAAGAATTGSWQHRVTTFAMNVGIPNLHYGL